MFGIGPNTIWLDLHGLLMFLILIFAAFLFGAIFFAKEPDAQLVRRLKISGAVTFVLLMVLMIPGLSAVVGFLIFYYCGRVITTPAIRRSVLSLMVLTGVWTLVIGAIGVYITKVLTFPVGQ